MRNKTSKVLLLTLAICIITVKLFAQTAAEGKITGKVLEASNNQTVPFATAVLLDRKTKANVKIVQTDMDGNFALTNLPKGVYTFKLSYLGFQTNG